METSFLEYRPARRRDLGGVVELFRRVHPGSIWSQLGKQATREYFDFYVGRPQELLIVSVTPSHQIVGLCLGTGRPEQLPGAFYREQIFGLALAVVREPRATVKAVPSLAHRIARGGEGEGGAPPPGDGVGQGCSLSLFAVAPEWRGRGIGGRLIEAFLSEMGRRGFSWCAAHTTEDNLPSQRAQTRAGFVLQRRVGHDLFFRRVLSPAPKSPDVTLQTTIVSDPGELAALADVHFQLWQLTPEASAFETLEWSMASWRHRARKGERPIAIAFRRGTSPIAIFPLCLRHDGVLVSPASQTSNYGGPVYDPAYTEAMSEAWRSTIDEWTEVRGVDLRGLRERSPFFRAVQNLRFRRLGRPAVVSTNISPEIDLTSGWAALVVRHSARQRSAWRRKWTRLQRQGHLRFNELVDPADILRAVPRLQELYDARWRGRRITAAFSAGQDAFQRAAIQALGQRGLVRLSVLELNGRIIAFSYGLRGIGVTTSYVLAHDARFDSFSPGLLLLQRVLEGAAQRGDVRYDFSLGDEPYKAAWATHEQRVFSLSWGRGSGIRAMGRRAWVAARDIPDLRRLKQGGTP